MDPLDAMYSITSAGKVFWGGDTLYQSYGQSVQYTRLYLDYVPTSLGQMLNLAWMHPGGVFNEIFHYTIMLFCIRYLVFFFPQYRV